jgi:tetratricopeptide (TPR) repeat protein
MSNEPTGEQHVLVHGRSVPFREAVVELSAAAERARQRDPVSEANYLTLGANVLYNAGHLGEAIRLLREAEDVWRETFDLALLAECLGLKASWLVRAKQPDAALTVLEEVERIDRALSSPKLEITLEQRFAIYYELDRLEEMQRVANEFFRIAQDAEAIARIRRCLRVCGIEAGAEAAREHPYDRVGVLRDRLEEIDSANVKGKTLLMQAADRLEEKDYLRAEAAAAAACQLQSSWWQAWWIRAQGLLKLERYAECLAALDSAISLNNQDPAMWWMKGHTLSYLGRYEEEITCCDRALALKPDYVEAVSMKAAALIGLRRYQEAADASHRAISMRETYDAAWMNLGSALMGLKAYGTARQAFETAAQLGNPRGAEGAAHCAAREKW